MFYAQLPFLVEPLAILGIVVLGIIALSGGRGEPDPGGDRAYVLYLSLVSYVAMFTLLFAVAAIISAAGETLVDAEPHVDEFGSTVVLSPQSPPGEGEQRARDAITGGAVALVAGLVLLVHRRRSGSFVDGEGFARSPARRTHVAYLYAVAFTAVAVVLVAGALALIAGVRAAAPGTVSSGASSLERDAAITDLFPALTLSLGAGLIYLIHRRAADRFRGTSEG
ncbi:MAG: hypothetical protein M3279_11315 [Actinomycetota bacterium]|nr:hypothetical protein [Actinomycetota bacterium]